MSNNSINMASDSEDSINKETTEIEELRFEIDILTATLQRKKQRLNELEEREAAASNAQTTKTENPKNENPDGTTIYGNELNSDDIERYSRQLILPNFGVAGQLKLKQSSFLIVGLGGLGCPAAQYLLAAGCGRLGLVDFDVVERSNFHRQTLHTETRIGMSKVDSARISLLQINPHCQVDTYETLLNSRIALEILAEYDIILDCTDNVATRYLLNDACVMLRKPLVSGSALQLDGQLTVYNYGELGPCYRCIFPVPPPPETVTNCGDGGVLGAVTGAIGALQALEAIKVCVGDEKLKGEVLAGRLLIFDGARCVFRNIKIRNKRTNCDVCSTKPLITELVDYEQFCGMQPTDKYMELSIIEEAERMSVEKYQDMQQQPHLLIDVRQPAEFEICRLPQAKNMPLKRILDDAFLKEFETQLKEESLPIVVLCRRGNDSQIAVQHMRNRLPKHQIHDIIGGLYSWHFSIDEDFPIY